MFTGIVTDMSNTYQLKHQQHQALRLPQPRIHFQRLAIGLDAFNIAAIDDE